MKKFFVLFVLVLSLGLQAHAQTGSAQVTATAAFSVSASDTITIKAQIVSCGNGLLPLYNGIPISLTPNQTPLVPFTATNTGTSQTAVFTVPGNDQIHCGGQTYTLYAITWYDNGFPLAPTQTYRFVDATSQSLSNLVPVSFVPPVLTNAAGAFCPTNTPIFLGFNSNYQIQCAANSPSSSASLPITGGNLLGNLLMQAPYVATLYSVVMQNQNGVIEADQYPGADMCAKINAAELAAVASGTQFVNASNFAGPQACASNMFANLNATASATAGITVLLGNVHILSTVEQLITNSGVGVWGLGPNMTQIEYTGTSTVTAVLYINGTLGSGSYAGNGINSVHIKGIFVYGDAANATDAIRMDFVNRSKFEDVYTWGATNAGWDIRGAVTDTFIRTHTSVNDAFYQGIQSAGHTVPAFGHIFGGYAAGNIDSTNGTVIDAADEGVTTTGWFLTSAVNMFFSAGTSEDNVHGLVIDSTSTGVNPGTSNKLNTFMNSDLEGNSLGTAGGDVTDTGQQNMYINITAASTCSSCSSVISGGTGNGGGQIIIGDAVMKTGHTGPFVVIGNNPDFSQNEGTTTAYVLNASQLAASVNLIAPIFTSGNAHLPSSCTAGTGVTSCTVNTGATEARGILTIVNASATTAQVLATMHFGATLVQTPFCTVQQVGGTANYGLNGSNSSTTTMQVSNSATVSGVTTITAIYQCVE